MDDSYKDNKIKEQRTHLNTEAPMVDTANLVRVPLSPLLTCWHQIRFMLEFRSNLNTQIRKQLPKNKLFFKKNLLNNKEDLMNSPHSPKSSVIDNLMVKTRFEVLAVWASTDKHLQLQQAHCSRLTQW